MPLSPVMYILGILLSLLAVAMLIPAGLDFYDGHENWAGFLGSSAITLFFGFGLLLSGAFHQKLTLLAGRMRFEQSMSWWELNF